VFGEVLSDLVKVTVVRLAFAPVEMGVVGGWVSVVLFVVSLSASGNEFVWRTWM
jgi:hypothetical protein